MTSAGLSHARLARMHAFMEGYVERGELPGLITLVSRRGEVHVDVIGSQALGGSVPMRRDTIFRISSMSKPITAAATMLLVEECALRLDDPVDRWLPELADRRVLERLDAPLDRTVPAQRAITVRDLLTFCWGFGQLMEPSESFPILQAAEKQQLGMGPPSPAKVPAPDEWMRRLGQLPLMCQPGERWIYNTGSDVLSVLIARVSGRPFETFLRERLFEPLGMKDTGFSVPAGSLDRLATSYWPDAATGALTVYDEPAGQWSSPPAFPSGAGGMVSTIDDYLAFTEMLRSHGKYRDERILSRLSVEVMTTDQLTPAQKAASTLAPGFFERNSWGFGVSMVTQRDDIASVPGRYGWDGGLGTSWYNDPAEDMTIILMTQCAFASAAPPNVYFWTLAYQAIDD